MKKISAIPTLCTLGNAACGFAAIVYSARLNQDISPAQAAYVSGWLIFVAMIFDVLDGYLARLSRSASDFGAMLDSLCDVISFGVAPAFLVVNLAWLHFHHNRLVWDVMLVIATLYVMCAILRLARFTVQTNMDAKAHRVFRGLPSPAAAGCLASLVIMRYDFRDRWYAPEEVMAPIIQWAAPLGALIVSLLMVSRISYPHVMSQFLKGRRHNFGQVVQIVVMILGVLVFREMTLVVLFWLYALSGPAQFAFRFVMRRHGLPSVREQSP